MRSKLFVPGNRPELFPKAYAGGADAISLDLEDAVPPAQKAQARQQVAEWLAHLAANPAAAGGKTTIVRLNAQGSPWHDDDLAAIVQPGLDLVNLPKPEDPASVAAFGQALQALEQQRGLSQPVGILVNIETPRALRCALELALAHPRVSGLQLGLADLFEPAAIDRANAIAVAQAMFQLRLAASEAGVYAYDAAFPAIQDTEGFQAEARLSHGLGFLGKTCIHPSQVALANAVYRPTAAQIDAAIKLLEASARADAQGQGVCVVDGRMVDAPFIESARALLRQARQHDASLPLAP